MDEADARVQFSIYMRGDGERPEPELPTDQFQKFLSDAELAGAYGGRHAHQHIAALAEETALIDKRAEQIYKARAPKVVRKAAQSEWEQEIDAGGRLEKRYSGVSGYREWLQGQVALGKSADEAIDDWAREFPNHRPEVLAALRAVAAEF